MGAHEEALADAIMRPLVGAEAWQSWLDRALKREDERVGGFGRHRQRERVYPAARPGASYDGAAMAAGDGAGPVRWVTEHALARTFASRRAGASNETIAADLFAEWFPSGVGELHLYLEAPCDQRCEFCEEGENRDRPERRALRVLDESFDALGEGLVESGALDAVLARAAGERVLFMLSGHDWLRHPRVAEIVGALERHPTLEKILQGPSTALLESELRERILALGRLRCVRLTLQSSDPEEHDAMVGRAGAGRAVLDVIAALTDAGVGVELTTVLTRRALRTLPETTRWIAAAGLRVSLSAFIPDRRLAGRDALAPSDEVRDALHQVDAAAVAQLVGVPICAVPERLRMRLTRAWASDEREGAVFGEPCAACSAQAECSGVPTSLHALFGARGLVPEDRAAAIANQRPGRSVDVVMILPPDFAAPRYVRTERFPPLGPAVVAAVIAQRGYRTRAIDLLLDRAMDPTPAEVAAIDDPAKVRAHLAGRPVAEIEAVVERMMVALESHEIGSCDVVAISLDRGSQLALAALLATAIKARFEKRVIVGGVATHALRALLSETNAVGADIVTAASSPPQIVSAFDALMAMPEHRKGPPIESISTPVVLTKRGLRKAPSMDGWPLPEFGIYDLERYRRDALAAARPTQHGLADKLGKSLILPYFFALECQFSCSFCQTGGNQESKPVADVVRDLATLAERHHATEFMFFNAQSNLLAPELSRELIAARLDLRWSDSYRVRPSNPGDLELMARAGCASITVGVESASDRVLQRMVKGHRAEHAAPMLARAHELGMLLRVNLLSCFPGETAEDFAATRDWVREHARMIDDLAPSSFYLTADSPIGRDPTRYGIVLRGPRPLRGDTKFRKSPDSLEYDEVDGMSWEEREPLLMDSEDQLRRAWLEGRGDVGAPGLSPPLMLALHRRFASKREIYDALSEWQTPRVAQTEQPLVRETARVVRRARVESGASAHASSMVEQALEAASDRVLRSLHPGATLHAFAFQSGCVVFKGVVGPVSVRGRVALRARIEEQVTATEASWAPALHAGCEVIALPTLLRLRSGGTFEDRRVVYGREVELVSFVVEGQIGRSSSVP